MGSKQVVQPPLLAQGREILYFDGRCPVCSAEMKRLERLADDRLLLVDIHQLSPPQLPAVADRQTLLTVLHLRTADGRWLTGLEANVAAWQHTRYGILWRWLLWPLVGRLAAAAYGHWARRRYQRLYGVCETRCQRR